jgi:hypothetical protein
MIATPPRASASGGGAKNPGVLGRSVAFALTAIGCTVSPSTHPLRPSGSTTLSQKPALSRFDDERFPSVGDVNDAM